MNLDADLRRLWTRCCQCHWHKGWQRRWCGWRAAQRSSGKSTFCLIDPASKQIRIEPVFQRDRRNRYADSLTGRYNLGRELLAVALTTTTLRE